MGQAPSTDPTGLHSGMVRALLALGLLLLVGTVAIWPVRRRG